MNRPRCLWASTLMLFSLSSIHAQTATSRIVSAANAFLATLDEKQRQGVMFAFDDEEQRVRWSNFPISIVPRAGLAVKDMTPAQHTAAMKLLAAALSKRGLEKVQQIMEADEVLKSSEANGRGGGPPRAGDGFAGRKGDGRRTAVHRRAAAQAAIEEGAGREAACCSARISTTSPSSARLPRRLPGCCSSADITWR